MTNTEIIQAIRNEIERRWKHHRKNFLEREEDGDKMEEDAYLLQYLSGLEKSEKPAPNDLQEYASRAGFDHVDDIEVEDPGHRWNDHDVEYAYRDGIIAGAKWDRSQMMKEAIHYVVQDDLDSHGASYNIPFIRLGTVALKPKGIGVGDRVCIIIVKED